MDRYVEQLRERGEYHCYRKFQGAHWTLAALAELGYPPGDASLLPVVDQVHDWLTSPKHLEPPWTEVIPGQEDRVRRCASQEGLAIWYLHELGLVDERVDVLVSRLVVYQWPDGGWNCDKRPAARTSSVQETLLPLRGLARHLRAERDDPPLGDAVETVSSGGTFADWGPAGRTRANPFVSIDATWVLRKAAKAAKAAYSLHGEGGVHDRQPAHR